MHGLRESSRFVKEVLISARCVVNTVCVSVGDGDAW